MTLSSKVKHVIFWRHSVYETLHLCSSKVVHQVYYRIWN